MKIFFYLIAICALDLFAVSAQQEAQYTQYMYNTMIFNPGYTGSRELFSVMGLYRTQWVGLEGAPKTISFSIESPVGSHGNGLGLNLISDQIGPVKNTGLIINYAYTILGSSDLKYSFGISGAFDNFEVDYTKLNIENPDFHLSGVNSQFSPNIGAGFYLHSYNWYLGFSTPKLLKTSYYSDVASTTFSTKSHFYLIGGYVFYPSPYVKFKPAALIKAVEGAPVAVDFSLNTLINDKFTLGAMYRWDAAFGILTSFQITEGLQLGYAYDYDTTNIANFNSGSHEIFLRFDLLNQSKSKLVSPRFF